MKNNAETAWNRTGRVVKVYFNSNYSGVSDPFVVNDRGNVIPALKNDNASHRIS